MDPRIETSLARALETQDVRDLLERAAPAMGLPGPRPRMEVAREIAQGIARARGRGRDLARLLGGMDREDAKVLAASAFAAFAVQGGVRTEVLAALQELAGDERATVRAGAVDAVRMLLNADLPATLVDLREWMDGFLQAHVALEAITERQILANIPQVDPVREMLDAAFTLCDDAPRAADRWQGVRTLRQGLPAQISAFVSRFGELYGWVMAHMKAERPETREVMEQTITALSRASLKKADLDALRDALAKSAKAPRDPSRIVHGTRKRSKR